MVMTDGAASSKDRPKPFIAAILRKIARQRAAAPMLFGILTGVVFAAVGVALRLALLGPTSHRLAYLTFYPCIALAAIVAGAPGGAVATLASALLVHLIFIPVENATDVLALAIFCASNLLVAVVAERLYDVQANAVRLEASDALTASLSQIVETSLDAIYSIDPRGIVLTWNTGAERLYGYRAHEIVGKPANLFVPDNREGDLKFFGDHARRGDPVVGYETERRHKSGAIVLVELTASPIRSASGAPLGVSVIARDITERKKSEDALRAALLQVRSKFENAAVGMADVSADGVWLRVNEKLCAIVGYSSDELMRMTFADITHPDDLDADLAQVRELLDGRKQTYAMEKRYVRKDGAQVWVNLTVGAVCKPDGAFDHFLSIIEDITERKQAEANVELLNAEVNHRANNLLTVVQSVARQTARNGDPASYVGALCDRIQSLAASQKLLVENEWRGTEMRDLVHVQLAMFQDLIGDRIVVDGPRAQLSAAATQGVGMALHELATNAAKYGALSNASGRVRIEWTIEQDAFRISWREEDGPTVQPPARRGFGQTVLGRIAEAAANGKSEIDYAPSGVRWILNGSSSHMLEKPR